MEVKTKRQNFFLQHNLFGSTAHGEKSRNKRACRNSYEMPSIFDVRTKFIQSAQESWKSPTGTPNDETINLEGASHLRHVMFFLFLQKTASLLSMSVLDPALHRNDLKHEVYSDLFNLVPH